MSDKFDAKALQRLYEATTQGEWKFAHREFMSDVFAGQHECIDSECAGYDLFFGIRADVGSQKDAEFITAIHNAFPAILAHIESLEKRLAELEGEQQSHFQIEETVLIEKNNQISNLQRENAALKGELDRWKAGFALLHDETCDDENCTRISHQSDYVEKLQQELAALKEQDELHWKTRKTLVADNAALKDWIKCANQFAWAHEVFCPRHNGSDAPCTCGLDEFLSKPRLVVESYKQELAALREFVGEAFKNDAFSMFDFKQRAERLLNKPEERE